MTLYCPDGHVNPDGATFCDQCGKPLMAAPATGSEEQPTAPAMPSPAPPDADNEATQIASSSPAAQANADAPQAAPEMPAAAPPPMAPPSPDLAATVIGSAPAEPPAAAPPAALPAMEPASPPPAPAALPVSPAPPAMPAMPAPPPAPPMPAASAPAAAPTPANPRLVVQKSGTTFDLAGKTSVLVGREDAPSNSFPDIDLTPYGAEENGVSRLHARLSQSGDQWTIEDLESTNFTFVGGKRIPPKTPTPLNDGEEIRLGRLSLRFTTSG